MAKTTWTAGKVVAVILGSLGALFVGWVLLVVTAAWFGSSAERDAKLVRATVTPHGIAKCDEDPGDIAVTISNGSGRTLQSARLSFTILQEGWSTDLAPSGMKYILSDRIVASGKSETVCYSVGEKLQATKHATWTATILSADFTD